MNTFSQIVAGVGTRVGDTSSVFATEIKKYVNFRYKEIFERFNWGTINPTYTFNTVAGTSDYQMAADFFKPLYAYDNTNSMDIKETDLQEIERDNPTTLSSPGHPIKYAQYDKLHATTNVLEHWVRLYPTPSQVITILMPYQVAPTDLSGDTDVPIMDCDYEVEIGATAEAWRTKRQFAKAADFDRQFDEHINHMIWRRENQPNKVTQFSPTTYPHEQLY